AQQRGLPRAGGAQDHGHGAGGDRQVDAAQHLEVAEGLVDAADLDPPAARGADGVGLVGLELGGRGGRAGVGRGRNGGGRRGGGGGRRGAGRGGRRGGAGRGGRRAAAQSGQGSHAAAPVGVGRSRAARARIFCSVVGGRVRTAPLE